jgi:hypothetical protein
VAGTANGKTRQHITLKTKQLCALTKAKTQTDAGIPGSHGSRSLTPSSDHRSAENPPTDEGSPGVVHGESVETHCVNDPSAGSPTETLLRLLLPLSDKVH